MQRKAIIIGATGLVGQQLVKQLSALYDKIIVIARRPPRYMNASMHYYQLNDFANLADTFANLDLDYHTDAFSCLGTTQKQAGSEEAFRQVDYNYNVDFATLCFNKGVRQFFLLSALGAQVDSRIFYNRVKAETELAIEAIGFTNLTVFRPSLLLGKHKGRPLERLSQGVFRLISPIVPESVSVHPISAKRVAIAMAMTAHQLYEQAKFRSPRHTPKTTIIENKQMLAMTRVKS
ncbi:NAD-dependent epimerase/dehydratase family protein [Psychrobacter pygoscelis]|uniref:NAD-dependent epimerase/dehydratase family protein n=1 Tax=Psychrobacter pygoscelis TaxID=2488563 RepID=UPI00103AB88C|nr:NAD-dependent epimerase/dehydratase family protein [Psychrobacter pygoscelis]